MRSPDHVNLSHLECRSVRATAERDVIERLDNFLTQRRNGWRYWRTTYFGFFQNAFPYAQITAYDARSNFLYVVGIDRNQITFLDGDVRLSLKTTPSEHYELLDILKASDELFADILSRQLETLRLMYPAVEALDRHKRDVGRYPSNEEGIVALLRDTGARGWNGPYTATVPVDAWATPFRFYTVRFDINDAIFEYVWSAGHDREFDFPKPEVWKGNDVYWTLEGLHDRIRAKDRK